MNTSDRRSPCPVACTLDLIGDRWTLLVVRDLLCGKQYFGELCASPEGIATNILSNRLDRLRRHGLIERFPSPDRAGRYVYRLTAAGRALEQPLGALADWGLLHLEGTAMHLQPSTAPSDPPPSPATT